MHCFRQANNARLLSRGRSKEWEASCAAWEVAAKNHFPLQVPCRQKLAMATICWAWSVFHNICPSYSPQVKITWSCKNRPLPTASVCRLTSLEQLQYVLCLQPLTHISLEFAEVNKSLERGYYCIMFSWIKWDKKTIKELCTIFP